MLINNKLSMKGKLFLCTVLIMLCFLKQAAAQSLLDKRISVHFNNERLSEVLSEISSKGAFYFSYNGKSLPKDSLITIAQNNETIYNLLNQLFQDNYEFEERKKHIIITPALMHLSLVNIDVINDNNSYSVSGLVVDERTGERLMNTSVYEKKQLVSALTDEHGYFSLKMKAGNIGSIGITASKRLYKDTTIHFLQNVLVISRPASEENINYKGTSVENTRLGRLFISAKQMTQSLNIPDFFAKRPFQVSLLPGLSSCGMFSPQVSNRFSLNLIGGYTAGVNGVEIGSLFNINKRNAKYVQLAGVFNLTGGTVTGLQAAGVNNQALDTVKGVQLAGFINKAESQVNGLQVAALHNKAHKLKGVQLGLFNIADTSEGVSIGLVNIIRNGFYKVTFSANNLTNTNISLKTGTHGFYSKLLTGINISGNNKMYSFGLGIGHNFLLSNKVYISGEADYQFAYTGSWDDRWAQAKLLVNLQLSKNISIIAGPTYNKYSYTGSQPGYQSKFLYNRFQNIRFDNNGVPYGFRASNPVKKWAGWEAGIAFNSTFKPAKKISDSSQAWYIGIAATGGVGWDAPYGFVAGGEFFAQRDLGKHLCGTLSAGYTCFDLNHTSQTNQWYVNGQYVSFKDQPYKIIPVKAGVRLQTGKSFYIGGELGAAFSLLKSYSIHTSNSSNRPFDYTLQYKAHRSFVYVFSAGFVFHNGLDAGVKFEDYGLSTINKQLALRFGYRIKFSK